MEAIKLKNNNLNLLNYDEMLHTNGGSPKVAIGWKIAAGLGVIGVGAVVAVCVVYGSYKLVNYLTK